MGTKVVSVSVTGWERICDGRDTHRGEGGVEQPLLQTVPFGQRQLERCDQTHKDDTYYQGVGTQHTQTEITVIFSHTSTHHTHADIYADYIWRTLSRLL